MSTLSLAFTVTDVPVEGEFTLRRNFRKPLLFPRYQGFLRETDAVCGFVGSKEILPTSSLSILHQEDSLEVNSPEVFSRVKEWVGDHTTFPTKEVLVTDVIGDFISRTRVPFFSKTVLPDTTITPSSVAILDKNLVEVPRDSYRVERIPSYDDSDTVIPDSYEEVAVYSNYKNTYNEETGEFEIYYIRFLAAAGLHYKLLDQQPAFRPAELKDVSLITGSLKPWVKAYLYRETPGGGYTFILPLGSRRYFLKPKRTARIALEEPRVQTDTDPWFPKVTNGSFSNVVGGEAYYYSVPEYQIQHFSPMKPYKVKVEERALPLSSNLFKVASTPLKVDTALFPIDVLIRNREGKVLYALTTKVSKAGTQYLERGLGVVREIETGGAWVVWDGGGILSWDRESGILHLQGKFSERMEVFVSYYYEEEGYELTELNTNPIFDADFAGQSYVIYAVPRGGINPGTTSRACGIHHLQVDRSGLIVSTSQNSASGNFDFESFLATYPHVWYSKSSSAVTDGVTGAGSSTLVLDDVSDWPSRGTVLVHNQAVIGAPFNGAEFWRDGVIKSYNGKDEVASTLSLTSAIGTEIPSGASVHLVSFKDIFSTSDTVNYFQWFVLGQVTPYPAQRVDELSILDLRRSGGRLKEKYLEEALAIDPRAVWIRQGTLPGFGQAFPGDTAVVIKVPFTLLKDYGGLFAPDEIEAIVARRHLAIGKIPVILYYGAIPEIVDITIGTDTVILAWTSEGDSYLYNIYRSFSPDGDWEKVNAEPIPDYLDVYSGSGGGSVVGQGYGGSYGVETNAETVTGLVPGVKYYFCVTSISPDGVEGPKGRPWGVKTRR